MQIWYLIEFKMVFARKHTTFANYIIYSDVYFRVPSEMIKDRQRKNNGV